MNDLRQQLLDLLHGRVCLVGVGNVELGDDGVGVRLAEALRESASRNADQRYAVARVGAEVIIAHISPERYLSRLTDGGFANVLFLDAVECGVETGALVLLDSAEMATRFPQVSTHKLSLGLLARMIEANGRTRCWLLGIQPAVLQPAARLSPEVEASRQWLAKLLRSLWANKSVAPTGRISDFRFQTSDPLVSC